MKLRKNEELSVPFEELNFSFARSSGAGGQNVNKVNSKAVLRWPVTKSSFISSEAKKRFLEIHRNRITSSGEIILSSEKFRDQGKNISDCIEKLRSLLLKAEKESAQRVPTKPTRGSRKKRLQNKKQASEKKVQRRKIDF